MKKFLFRLTLISGTLIGIAYWKKDAILDALIQHSIDVDRINNSIDDVLEKTEIVKKRIAETKQAIQDSKGEFSAITNDVNDYTNEINPIVNNIKDEINRK